MICIYIHRLQLYHDIYNVYAVEMNTIPGNVIFVGNSAQIVRELTTEELKR